MKKETMVAYCAFLTEGKLVDYEKFPELKGYTPTIEDWADLRSMNQELGDKAEEAVKAERKKAAEARALEILGMGDKEAIFAEFIENPGYTYKKLTSDDKGNWSAVEATGSVDFFALERQYQLLKPAGKEVVENGKTKMIFDTNYHGNLKPDTSVTIAERIDWASFTACFLHNCQQNILAEINTPLTIKVSPCAENFAKDNNMVGYGKKKLAEQLNTAMRAILPAPLVPMFRTKDVNYLLQTVVTGKNGKLTVITEKQLVKELFVVVRIASKGGDYEVKSRAKMYNEKKKNG